MPSFHNMSDMYFVIITEKVQEMETYFSFEIILYFVMKIVSDEWCDEIDQ